MKLKDSIKFKMVNDHCVVFLRSEFSHLGSESQIGKALTCLLDEEFLVRVSLGAYAKTRINKFTGRPAAAGTLELITAELFSKLCIEVSPSRLVAEYNNGKSTQIPVAATIRTPGRRITRKVTVGNRTLSYE